MRQIQPVSSWKDGQIINANSLRLLVVNDNLSSSAIFYYELLETVTDSSGNITVQNKIAQGNLNMDGQDYQNWGNTGDINNEAYVYSAAKLGLSLV